MVLNVNLNDFTYDIVLERGAINQLKEEAFADRRCFIVTDDGVPVKYVDAVAAQCSRFEIAVVPSGEESKSLSVAQSLWTKLLEADFGRSDCVIAVGGGVVGDLAGFTASCYMRGIDFYNVPTTLLSQLDSSVGGKTALNLNGIKNPIGTFFQPKKVFIDPDVLSTLPERQISNGFAEAVKVALTSDSELFSVFENGDAFKRIDEVISRSLKVKIDVVQADEKERGLRRVLNFGHTIGHGIESVQNKNGLLHGECVALGMIPMVSDTLRPRLIAVLENLHLPVRTAFDADRVLSAVAHDKKSTNGYFHLIRVHSPGTYSETTADLDFLREALSIVQR